MHVYDRLMTQYLPISNVLTTFIAALDSTAIEHTFLAVRPPARMGSAAVGLAGKAAPERARTARGHGQYPD
jgi:hypothetical protein